MAFAARFFVQATPFKHQQVEHSIRQLTQTLPVGARLPAERNLAVSYGCNFLTVRRALKALVDDGTVVRRIGSGTFVARHTANAAAGVGESPPRVGVLVFRDSDAYAYRVLQAVAQAGARKGLELRSSWIAGFGAEAVAQAKRLVAEGCVGLVLPWFPSSLVEEVREFVARSPLPPSLPMAIPGLERHCFVDPARFGGGTQRATNLLHAYFQALGAEQIALLGPDSPSDTILQKALSAYVCRTSRDGAPNLCGLVGPGAAGMDQLAERWARLDRGLAIISYDDEHALRFMTAMHKRGLSAPHDFRIAGFNNTEASAFADPPLSTIPQNFDDISEWLLNNALALGKGSVAQSPGNIMPRLLVRDSCGGRGRIDEAFRASLASLGVLEVDDAAAGSATPFATASLIPAQGEVEAAPTVAAG